MFNLSNDRRLKDTTKGEYEISILISIMIQRYYEKKNYFEIIKCLVVLYYSAASVYIKNKFKVKSSMLDIVYREIVYLCAELVKEASSKKDIIEGEALCDFIGIRYRANILAALCAIMLIFRNRFNEIREFEEDKVEELLDKIVPLMFLWGEGAVPYFLCVYWHLSVTDARNSGDKMIFGVLSAIVKNKTRGLKNTLLGPYYTFEEVARNQLAVNNSYFPRKYVSRESCDGRSHFLESIINLLVRQNYKQTLKSIWHSVSKIDLEEARPCTKYDYCQVYSNNISNVTRQHSLPTDWGKLVESSCQYNVEYVDEHFSSRVELLLLYMIIVPYRATPDIVRYIDTKINKCWFSSMIEDSGG